MRESFSKGVDSNMQRLSQIDPSIVEVSGELPNNTQTNPTSLSAMANLFVNDSASQEYPLNYSNHSNHVINLKEKEDQPSKDLPIPHPLIEKDFVYEVAELYSFFEDMKRNTFNPYTEIVSRHPFRYCISVVRKMNPRM